MSGDSAQPEDFIYLLLDDSEQLVNFLEHFENVSFLNFNINILNLINYIIFSVFGQMVYVIIEHLH